MSQVKISGNASGTGVLTIAAPNTNTDRSITLPDKAGEVAVGAGTIVQVVQGTSSTEVVITTTTFTDTGLSASITPTSSSNKILITTNQQYQWFKSGGAVDQGIGIKLLRDSTTIWEPPVGAGPYYNYIDNSGEHNNYSNIIYLDSPATTSSVTYKTQGRPYTTADSGNAKFQTTDVVSAMILMEVVA